jgi:two-component system, LytTR family, response regulator
MIGRTLSHYRILAELGRGGMGTVYRALDVNLEREVALKVLSPALFGAAELRRRFVQEARALAALQHPAIAVVHEIDEAEGSAFIVLELIPGDTLKDLIARQDLDVGQALDLGLEIAEAMAAAHARGIVHRDLKPTNVLVTPEGRARVIDFGLAKLLDPAGPLGSGIDTPPRGQTDPGRILGTVAYMSPEQARGSRIDARSDIFGFGSLLHEMLTGARAFDGPSPIETLHAILKTRAPRLTPLGVEGTQEVLQGIVDRCLEKDPADRYQTMADLIAALRAVRHLSAPPPAIAAGPPPARPAPRSPGKLRVVLVDDEDLARQVLREFLASHEDVEIVAECANGFEAVKAVAELRPDLLFLDVQMPKLTGFEVLELIDRDVGVVFVTAHDEFALKAFEVHAIDYLLKPFGPERLHDALARARKRLVRPEPVPVAELASAARGDSPHLERVLVRQGAQVHVIPVGRLDYVEAQDDYIGLRSEGKQYLKEQTLGQLEAQLDPARFVRIHRSYILNVDSLSRLELYAKDSRVAILKDGTRLPVSRAGYARLKTLL